jgi:hypothetical protein
MLEAVVLRKRETAALYVLQPDVVLMMEAKIKEDNNYIYLLEPFGGQVFVSGPNNTKHVTFNKWTLHKQR